MAGKQPSQRSREHFLKLGFHVGNVEKWIAQIKQRKDLFGFADLLVFRHEPLSSKRSPKVLVQVTSTPNIASRRAKVLSSMAAYDWIASGDMVLIHGWSKKGGKYVLKEELITLDMFDLRTLQQATGTAV